MRKSIGDCPILEAETTEIQEAVQIANQDALIQYH